MSATIRLLEGLQNPPQVLVKQVNEPRTAHICPNCHEEIGEKSTFLKEGTQNPHVWIHGPCGGEFVYPPPTPEEQAALDKWFKV